MVGFNPNYSHWQYCGCFVFVGHLRKYVPLRSVKAHTTLYKDASRTTLTQTFAPTESAIEELVYQFPLYDGVSVVSFTCTVGSKVIHGVVKERQEAKQTYDNAVAQGQTAGLMEQSLQAADTFTTKIGKVPAGQAVKVELTYLGELKHDAEVDGLRFTIPTVISPRYGAQETLPVNNVSTGETGFSVTVDSEMPEGAAIKSVQSPSHPISVQIGFNSTAADNDEPSLSRASASLSLGSAELDKDFIIQVTATKLGEPSAVLEKHPTLPNQRALMATLVPKFSIPADMPEIVFVCDRSGSMGGTKIKNLVDALNIFLRSLPVGVKFNICSFGNQHEFLWDKSQSYTQESLDKATVYISSFSANFGGTHIYSPLEQTFKRRYTDMNLEVFLLTDGEIWDQDQLFGLINDQVGDSKGTIRVFSLGIGRGASHSLIEGVARAGNGFSQTVSDDEKMDKKVVRMLKGALTPHISDYTLEIKYKASSTPYDSDDDFELIEKVKDALVVSPPNEDSTPKAPISLFDISVKDDGKVSQPDFSKKFDHLPTIETPRYLQAPSSIPPLFPFNRTTVYVLLSGDDDTKSNRIPTSVLLKATSAHGPLVLEIPVTVLPKPGETIHQLAARKAVKELEEGRGWIAGAKTKDDKLVKEAHEGRYSELVEREAVRLGVKYQVGGKWCSFVAVQEGSDVETEINIDTGSAPKIQMAHTQMARRSFNATGFGQAGGGAFGMAAFSAPPPPPAPAPAPATGQAFQRQAQAFGSASYRFGAPTAPSALFGGAPAPSTQAFGSAAAPSVQSFGAPPINMFAQQATSFGSPPPSSSAPGDAMSRGFGQAKAKLKQTNPFRKRMAVGSSSADTEKPDLLQQIASWQAFTGNWPLTNDLEALVGVTRLEARTAVEAVGFYVQAAGHDELLATAIALAFLQVKLADQKDAWEMMADKAVMWMGGMIGDAEQVQKWVDAIKGVLEDDAGIS